MNVTTNWINKYLDRSATTEEIAQTLANVGFECEECEPLANGDTRIDLEITSNRGDCVSMIGLAREFCAATGRSLRMPELDLKINQDVSAGEVTTVDNEVVELCPYYSARIIRGVKVGPSPMWLRELMESVGLRSVNNVVDVTNFILYELGQPLHTFDLDKLDGKRIVVRKALAGEKMTAIDGTKLTLDSSMMVIADAKLPVAVAGVMGSLDTEVGEGTTDILLEAAVFNSMSVRSTSRKLKLLSDSSYRFERGIHPATVAFAADRAARLISEVAGGEVLRGAVVSSADIPVRYSVVMRTGRLRAIAGIEIPIETVMQILDRLGLEPVVHSDSQSHDKENGLPVITCNIPYHRLDLTREIDLIEEVIRLHGFDYIDTMPKIEVEVIGEQADIVLRRRIDQVLAACGYHETVTFTFISEADARVFLPTGFSYLATADEQRKAEPVLRPSLLPSLFRCRKRNQDAGHENVQLFEHAACFAVKDGIKVEKINLALILDARDKQLGLRKLRATLDQVVKVALGDIKDLNIAPMDISWYEKDAAGGLLIGNEPLGTWGILSSELQDYFGLQVPIAAAELSLMNLCHNTNNGDGSSVTFTEMSSFPAIQRDLSIVIDEPIAWSKIEDVVRASELALLDELEFVGVYRSKQIGAGKKSLTMRLTFRDPRRTLRHEEVNPQIEDVIEKLSQETGATVRQ